MRSRDRADGKNPRYSILPRNCVHEAQEDFSFMNDKSVMLIRNSHTFEEDSCQQQMEDVHANADTMAEFFHFKQTSKQMSKEDVKTTKQQLQQQGLEDDSSITKEIEDDDIHKVGIDKASQILEDTKSDSGSNSDFNSDSVSILDLNSTAILDAKTNSDANFNGSHGKLDEEAKDIAVNDEVIFENADGIEFYHGDCQAISQFGSQADDVNVEVEDVQQNANLMSKMDPIYFVLSIQFVIWQEHVLYYYAVCLQDQFVSKMFWKIRLDSKRNFEDFEQVYDLEECHWQISNENSYSKLDANAYVVLDTELQTEFGLWIQNLWQMENERLVAKMEELKNKSNGIEVSAWGLSKWKPELSSGILEPGRNLAGGVESDVEKQAYPNFVAERALETDAEGVTRE
ncbi:hypothetical protein L7F22_065426 [Adiantum nelumboides]|nr:hypothetical protein [Adiantum nelumboides]